MASYVKWDTVERAQLRIASDGTQTIVRGGWLKDIHTNGVSNNRIFTQAVKTTGVPALLSPHPDPDFAACLLRQLIVDAQPGNNRKARILGIYSTQAMGWAEIPVTFVLQRRTTLMQHTTELHPINSRAPITVTWVNPADPTDVVKRVVAMQYLKPFQRLLATGYYIGTPPASMLGALGSVNDAPFRGFGKGYWLYASQGDVTRDRGGSYTIDLELWNKMTEDWSSWAVLRDHNGRYLKVDPADVASLAAQPYVEGSTGRNGVTKTGLYKAADLGGIFGFGNIP
jgi:hypothetical protein